MGPGQVATNNSLRQIPIGVVLIVLKEYHGQNPIQIWETY